jgi:hypothetical protein
MVWYQYGMVWYQYGMVWYQYGISMVWYGMVWYGMVWYVSAVAGYGTRHCIDLILNLDTLLLFGVTPALPSHLLFSYSLSTQGKVLIWIYEREGMYDYERMVDEQRHHWTFSCHSKIRKRKRAKRKTEADDEEDNGLTRQQKIAKAKKADEAPADAVELARYKNDTPLLWVRVDPEFEWLREVTMKQPDFMWVEQLCSDDDVAAQVEALRALTVHPTPAERTNLDRGMGVYSGSGDKASALAEKRLACSAIQITPATSSTTHSSLAACYSPPRH